MAAPSSTSRRLEGKVVIITGGASGLGEATARLFVANGASVLIADIQEDAGRRVAMELGMGGGGKDVAAYKKCDVREEGEVEGAVEWAVKKWGKVDVMVASAGIGGSGGEGDSAENMAVGRMDKVMAVNVRGTALAVKHAAKAMIIQGGGGQQKNSVINGHGGSIICMASISSVAGGLGPLDYVASKHAVLGIVRAAASDLGKHGIRVNAISPSAVITPLSLRFFRSLLGNPHLPVSHVQSIADSVNVLHTHRSLTPLDIAYSALFLASDESAFVSGLNLLVDGAITATRHPVPTTSAIHYSLIHAGCQSDHQDE